MNWIIFPLLKTRDGRKAGEFAVGTISFSEEKKTTIDCPDGNTQNKLNSFFSVPTEVRRARGGPENAITYEWETIFPGTEEYFSERLSRLHTIGFTSQPQE